MDLASLTKRHRGGLGARLVGVGGGDGTAAAAGEDGDEESGGHSMSVSSLMVNVHVMCYAL